MAKTGRGAWIMAKEVDEASPSEAAFHADHARFVGGVGPGSRSLGQPEILGACSI